MLRNMGIRDRRSEIWATSQISQSLGLSGLFQHLTHQQAVVRTGRLKKYCCFPEISEMTSEGL